MADLNRDHVREALDLVDFESQIGSPLRGAARQRRLDTLVQYFVSEFPGDTDGLRVSTDELDRRVRELLEQSNDRESPVEEFEAGFDRLPDEITSSPLQQFTLGIPLNLSPQLPFDELGFQNHRFERISRDDWTSKYSEPALRDDAFAEQFEEVPNGFEEEFTYWEFEYASRDPDHVLEIAERHLGVILGQLIYCLFPWSRRTEHGEGTVWNRPWSELRLPFVYILRDEDGYHSAYFDDDISPRETIQMLKDRQDRLKIRYKQIPPLENPNTIEEKIINAFRNFQSGATESNRRQAFLDYWRAVETLCLFGDERMRNIVPRAQTVISNGENGDELLERRLEDVKEKRNALVHEKVGVTITNRDTEFLRSILYQIIPFMIINREWEPAKIKLWLDNGSKSRSRLEDKIRELERKVEGHSQDLEVLQTLLDSRTK